MGLFQNRPIDKDGKKGVPVWFMRQAGRYHNHYQNLKSKHDFMTLCKTPELACEVTMGPIEEFDFDAAILFSDLLFPLEQIGMGLVYNPGPQLDQKLDSMELINGLKSKGSSADFYQFQKKACQLLKEKLPADKDLLGFAGAPFTLYAYSIEGSHSGNLIDSKLGLRDGRFRALMEIMRERIVEELKIQAEGGADAVCLFDTAAGELTLNDYSNFVLDDIRYIAREFKKSYPNKKLVYYSKFTHLDYLKAIECDEIDVLGVDWRMDIVSALKELGGQYYIQGNYDPAHLFLPWDQLKNILDEKWERLKNENVDLDRWICGLGHGVLPKTPQENVKLAIQHIHEQFKYN